jgi:hypothetical protein
MLSTTSTSARGLVEDLVFMSKGTYKCVAWQLVSKPFEAKIEALPVEAKAGPFDQLCKGEGHTANQLQRQTYEGLRPRLTEVTWVVRSLLAALSGGMHPRLNVPLEDGNRLWQAYSKHASLLSLSKETSRPFLDLA